MMNMGTSAWYPAKDDPQVQAQFLRTKEVDNVKTRQAGGEKVLRPVTVCVIKTTAGPDTITHKLGPNRESEKLIARFPEAYAALQTGEVQDVAGTPIEQLLTLDPARAVTWRLTGINTVEQFADLGDAALERLGLGARELQKVARNQLGEAGALRGVPDAHKTATEARMEQPQKSAQPIEGIEPPAWFDDEEKAKFNALPVEEQALVLSEALQYRLQQERQPLGESGHIAPAAGHIAASTNTDYETTTSAVDPALCDAKGRPLKGGALKKRQEKLAKQAQSS